MTILIAEDDQDDQLLVEEAFQEAGADTDLTFVHDGAELLDVLRGRGDHRAPDEPALVLLDLNMPRVDGRRALQEIKSDPRLKRIPVVVLTTSRAEEDILQSYDLGVNSFIVKPVTFDGLVDVVKVLSDYWLKVVERPLA